MKNVEKTKIDSVYRDATLNGSDRGFTIAEMLVTLTILGIVAVLIVPAMVRQKTKRENRTKLIKAVAAYESVANKIVLENGIKDIDSLRTFDCNQTKNYFNVLQNGLNNCQFKTTDGVWWDVSNFAKTIVAFKNTEKDSRGNDVNYLTAENAADDTKQDIFYLQSDFDSNGSLRVLDFSYGWDSGRISMVLNFNKINNFLGEKSSIKECDDSIKTKCYIKQIGSADCKTLNAENKTIGNQCRYTILGPDGKAMVVRRNCNSMGQCQYTDQVSTYENLPGVTVTVYKRGCDNQADYCENKALMIYERTDLEGEAEKFSGLNFDYPGYDKDNTKPLQIRQDYAGCDLDVTYATREGCSSVSLQNYQYKGAHDENVNITINGENTSWGTQKNANIMSFRGCNEDATGCDSSTITIGNGAAINGYGDTVSFSGCDGKGKNCKNCTTTNPDKYKCPSDPAEFTKDGLNLYNKPENVSDNLKYDDKGILSINSFLK